MFKSVSNTYLCDKGTVHEGKQIIMICLNKECDAKRLCCLTCIDQLHRKHELISLYKFQEMLQILTHKIDPQEKESLLKIIHLFEIEMSNKIQKARQNFEKEIEKSISKMKGVFSVVYESLNFEKDTIDLMEHVYQDFTTTKVNEFLELVKEAQSSNFKTLKSTESVLEKGQKIIVKQLQNSQKQSDNAIKEITKGIDMLKQSFNCSQLQSGLKQFSKQNKAASLTISDTGDHVKRSEGAGGYPIVLFDSPLSELNNNVSVKIDAQPGTKGIWMGVCILDVVKNFNFSSCYGVGKGTWAIDQVGQTQVSAYSWSHHDTNYNSTPKVGFQFGIGDVINIKVDFEKSTVIFSKGELKFEAPIRLDLGDIYAFVGPTHLGDSLSCI